MSTNKSQNLNLHLWEPEDDFLRTEFNENFAALDTAVKAEETARISAVSTETTARQNAVSSLQTAVNSKASTSALNSVTSELTTKINTAQSTANSAYSLASAPYASGSYTGDGTQTVTITVGFKPRALIVSGPTRSACAGASCTTIGKATPTFLSNGFRIFGVPADAFNESGLTYCYIAFR